MSTVDLASKVIVYSAEFLNSYTRAVSTNYPGALEVIREIGLEKILFPLYECEVGKDVTLAVLYTSSDFYLYFLVGGGDPVTVLVNADAENEFDRDWTFNTPLDIRTMQVRDRLDITTSAICRLTVGTECVNVPGTNFMHESIESMVRDAKTHGIAWGNQAGQQGQQKVPIMKQALQRQSELASFGERYLGLRDSSMRPQERGQKFEELWRDVLDFYSWHPKKIRIPGEENDFTAIYQGLHILGEVRWFERPMTGGKLREFLAKLDPRPQTIGMFISHSGLDEGAWSVVRRAVNSKTVVVFELVDIEYVLLGQDDIGALFNEKLREAYDYLFEPGHEL